MQDAFTAAIERWPATGLPPQPGGLDHHDGPQPRRSTGCAARRRATTGTPQAALLHAREPTPSEEEAPCPTTGCG